MGEVTTTLFAVLLGAMLALGVMATGVAAGEHSNRAPYPPESAGRRVSGPPTASPGRTGVRPSARTEPAGIATTAAGGRATSPRTGRS